MSEINQKDLKIISELRKDARNKATNIARTVDMPVTTLYDKLRTHKKKGIVKKHTTLVDFAKMGFPASSLVLFEPLPEMRNRLRDHLVEHPNVNTVYRTNHDRHFFAECIFEDHEKLQDFINETSANYDSVSRVFQILSKPKEEEFNGGLEWI